MEMDNIQKRPKDEKNTYGGGCPFWFMGDEKSADKDLKDKFEIVDEENSDNGKTV